MLKGLTDEIEYTISPVYPLTFIPDGLDSGAVAPLLCGA